MQEIPAQGTVAIHLPFKGLRVAVGAACLALGLLLAAVTMASAQTDIFSMAGILFVLIMGGGGTFLDKIVRITPAQGKACTEWLFVSLIIKRTEHDISGVDRVVVPVQQEVVVPEGETMWVADRSFPVLLCRGSEIIFRAFGWDYGKMGWGGRFTISLPSPTFFPSFAKHSAAVLAKALTVPLHYEPEGAVYTPEEIPAQWLDPASVRAHMAWRRYGER